MAIAVNPQGYKKTRRATFGAFKTPSFQANRPKLSSLPTKDHEEIETWGRPHTSAVTEIRFHRKRQRPEKVAIVDLEHHFERSLMPGRPPCVGAACQWTRYRRRTSRSIRVQAGVGCSEMVTEEREEDGSESSRT